MKEKGQHDSEGRRLKKPYTPPSIQRVELRPEEAVLGFCKNSAAAGPLNARCVIVSPCSSQGS